MNRLSKGNRYVFRKSCLVKISYAVLFNKRGNIRIFGSNPDKFSGITVIFRLVKRGNIVALYVRRKTEKLISVEYVVRLFVIYIKLHRFGKRFFSLSDIEYVEEIRNRLRIV